MTHEIIVYRNPLEQMVWSFWSENPDMIIYLLAGLALTVVALVVYGKIRGQRRWRR